MNPKVISHSFTLGISTVSNVQALLMTLGAVFNAKCLPHVVNLRCEGSIPQISHFYFEQMADIARMVGTQFNVFIEQSRGVRFARDWHIDKCKDQWLWMLDDDVIPHFDCLQYYLRAIQHGSNFAHKAPYLAGVKVDVNNRRGYKDFDHQVRTSIHQPPYSQNHFYDKVQFNQMVSPLDTLDTGNVMLNCEVIREHGLRFNVFNTGTNAGGEDAVFALACKKKGLSGLIVPSAQAVHIEKEKVNFNEQGARAEMVALARKII
jgi:hypothetical protein